MTTVRLHTHWLVGALAATLLVAACNQDPYTIVTRPGADAGPQIDTVQALDTLSPDKGISRDACVKTSEVCDKKDNDCDGKIDNVLQSLLDVDARNCGKCGTVCTYGNGFAKCVKGKCELDRCAPGFYDINKDLKDGCEYQCSPTNGGKEECPVGQPGCACDNADNDCDGKIDEVFNKTTDPNNCGACGTKCLFNNAKGLCVAGKCTVGNCDARFKDLNKSASDGCEYRCPVWPALAQEVCNGLDDDCDNLVDEGVPGVGGTCTTGLKGECAAGINRCQGGKTLCVANNTSSAELCDSKDNDCDGAVDEDFKLQTNPLHCGACNKACKYANGVPKCASGKCTLDRCVLGYVDFNKNTTDGCEHKCEVFPTSIEKCNGKDDDCDKRIDEDFNLTTDANHCGKCNNRCKFANAGASCVASKCAIGTCNKDFYDIDRSATNGCEYYCLKTNGGVEVCDGLDNNCDGKTDEGFNLTTDANNCGRCGNKCLYSNASAICFSSICVMGGCATGFKDLDKLTSTGCEYKCPVFPVKTTDTCDGLDSDCDGKIDEDFAPKACGNTKGECKAGATICFGGAETCRGGTGPVAETCDGKDNDCDGTIDNGFNKLIDPRNCGSTCKACAFPNAIATCAAGVCGIGACKSGFVNLNKLLTDGCEYKCTKTGVEVCDGLDNDCNGKIDDGVTLGGSICKTAGECSGATATCRGKNGWECSYGASVSLKPCTSATDCGGGRCLTRGCANVVAVDETKCDGLDDDCDGSSDEPWKAVTLTTAIGKTCDPTGKKGRCKDKGVYVCDTATKTKTICKLTVAGASPTAEVCNGIDDDCDGLLDDNVTDIAWVTTNSGLQIFKYEASRPDATTTKGGILNTGIPCSKTNRLPWTIISKEEANAACKRIGATLCERADWSQACKGAAGNVFPYGGSFQKNTCNGLEYDTDPGTPGTQSRALVVQQPSACVSVWTSGNIHNMSGNVKEWTAGTVDSSGNPTSWVIMGGAYDTPSLGALGEGMSCDYQLPAPSATLRLDTLGFRCCK